MHEGDCVAKMTKAQARKRLKEAQAKVNNVFVNSWRWTEDPVKGTDIIAFEKLFNKCINRLK